MDDRALIEEGYRVPHSSILVCFIDVGLNVRNIYRGMTISNLNVDPRAYSYVSLTED